MTQHALPTDSATRKNIPMCSGLLDYFPAALAEVAFVSYVGNEKHNPGEPLHHARGKSMDHADCIMRHLTDRGTTDVFWIGEKCYEVRHSAYVAWRALAMLQQELEEAGAPLARGAKLLHTPPLSVTFLPPYSGHPQELDMTEMTKEETEVVELSAVELGMIGGGQSAVAIA